MKLGSHLILQGILVVNLTSAVAGGTPQNPIGLGSNSTFVILAGTTVTTTGGGVINGNIGISPGTEFVAGAPPVTVNGNLFTGTPIASQAQADLTVAINDAAQRPNPATVSGDLGGTTLPPGLYQSASSLAILCGDLTLDAQGNPNAVFIFRAASTLTMMSGRSVLLTNGASAANIFWQVGSSATLGSGSVMHGNILAAVSISLLTGAVLDGRALAQSGAVTIDTGGANSVNIPAPPALRFIPVPPCRVADTRNPEGAFGGPSITGQSIRDFTIPESSCGIPLNEAQAYSLNVAVVPHGPLGYLTLWAAGQTKPLVATLNSDGRITSTAAVVAAGIDGAISVFTTGDTDVVLDVNGYFAPVGTAGGLNYYPLPPCRVGDTRSPVGPFGGTLLVGETRMVPVTSSSCDVPAGARAYSVNLAAVPQDSPGYLTAWAAESSQPVVASLNWSPSTTTSNAAIIPAGPDGSINVFASNDTDLVIDINGYFAAPGEGGLSFYALTPCRVWDSRLPPGTPFNGVTDIDVLSTSCGVPPNAQTYALKATAVPQGPLGYLTLWAQGAPQPVVASLNAWDGAITGNLAMVPTSNGSFSTFASNPTDLVIDLFGYFAPELSEIPVVAPTIGRASTPRF